MQSFVGKPEEKWLLEMCRHRSEDNIKMHFKDIGWEAVEWVRLSQLKGHWWGLVNMAMDRGVP
jgi:apolipoprotein N-acyltransferase